MATGESLLLALLLLGAGVLTVVTGLLFRRGKLPRNWFLGLRTPSTLRSDDAWRAAHEAAGSLIAVSGILLGATGVLVLLTDPADDTVFLAGSGTAVAVLLVAGVLGVRATKER